MSASTLNFSVDKVKILESSNKSQLAKIEIWIVAHGKTENTWIISENSIRGAVDTAYSKPVLAKYNKYRKDFMGHEKDEHPVGVFVSNGRLETSEDGRVWIVAEAVIWKRYYPEVMEVFTRKGGTTDVSAELEIISPRELTRGCTIEEMAIQGLTLLGVKPAVKGAKANVLQFSDVVSEVNKILKFEESPSIEGSLFEQFDIEFARNIKDNYPKVWSIYGNVKGDKNFSNFEQASLSEIDQDIAQWLIEREDWASKHAKESTINSLVAQMKMGVVCSQGIDFHKSALLEQIKNKYPEFSEKEEKENMQEDEKDLCKNGEGEVAELDDVQEPNTDKAEEVEEKEEEKEEADMAKLQAQLVDLEAELEKTKAESTVYMEELESLRQFKAEFEKKEVEAKLQADTLAKLSIVADTLNDPKVVTVLSAEEIIKFKETANEYNLENINVWANEVKVIAFSKIDLSQKTGTKQSFTRFSMGGENTKPENESKWRYKNK